MGSITQITFTAIQCIQPVSTDSNSASFIAMVAAIFSAIAAVASGIIAFMQFRRAKRDKKQENLNEIVKSIDNARQYYFTMAEALYRWKPVDRNAGWKYVFRGIIRAYLNSYEYACKFYIDNTVDKERFRSLFEKEIVSLVEVDIGADFGISVNEVEENHKEYEHIRKVAKEFKKSEQ